MTTKRNQSDQNSSYFYWKEEILMIRSPIIWSDSYQNKPEIVCQRTSHDIRRRGLSITN